MTASKKVIPLERRNSGWIKPAVVALCLIAAGFGAITVAEEAATRPHPSAASAAPETQLEAASEAAPGMAGPPTSIQAAVRVDGENMDAATGHHKGSDAASAPRECRPYEGVNYECTYN